MKNIKFSDNEQYSKSIVQRNNTKQEQSRALQRRSEHHLLTHHTRRMLFVVIGITGKFVDNSVFNNGKTINMKNDSQHGTLRNLMPRSVYRPLNV